MALIIPDDTAPGTQNAGVTRIYADATVRTVIRQADDQGNDTQITPIISASAAGQTISNTTRTYLTGSNVKIPVAKIVAGAIYRCVFSVTKTAAGNAASTIDVCVGTNGTTADTARVSFTKPAGTNATVDEMWVEIDIVCKTAGASGVLVGTLRIVHHGITVGHITTAVEVLQTTSGSFDLSVASLNLGVCFTAGASDNLTFSQVSAELLNC